MDRVGSINYACFQALSGCHTSCPVLPLFINTFRYIIDKEDLFNILQFVLVIKVFLCVHIIRQVKKKETDVISSN